MDNLTSTTAPGKVFQSRSELADHYKSDWHRYNLKRREAGLPLLLEVDFQARLEAAQALQQEKQAGTNHLKKSKQRKKAGSATQVSQADAYERIKEQKKGAPSETVEAMEISNDNTPEEPPAEEEMEVEKAIEIDPRQCLFDKHVSATADANLARMQRKYGFFVPDQEYLVDPEGLVGYCHEKIKLGHICLYCHKIFTTWEGCQKHMLATRHCKIRYEAGFDLDEFSDFYDFSQADAEFLGHRPEQKVSVVEDVADGGDDDGDWEDISDDEAAGDDEEDANEDESMYDGFEEEVQRMGFDVTPLGELIFPDGRIIGHRSLRRYYKQRPIIRNTSTAVVAAQNAAGERLYRGTVYNINNMGHSDENALALRQAGIAPGLAAGRAGKGILVANGGAFSQVSVYRYRAALRKQRRGMNQGQRLWEKSGQNINRMDKKHNRLMNGVSVAHAAR